MSNATSTNLWDDNDDRLLPCGCRLGHGPGGERCGSSIHDVHRYMFPDNVPVAPGRTADDERRYRAWVKAGGGLP